jgi:hypothetical protein
VYVRKDWNKVVYLFLYGVKTIGCKVTTCSLSMTWGLLQSNRKNRAARKTFADIKVKPGTIKYILLITYRN